MVVFKVVGGHSFTLTILWSAFFRRVSRRFIGHCLILPAAILWVSATAALLLPAALLWTGIWISLLIAVRGSFL